MDQFLSPSQLKELAINSSEYQEISNFYFQYLSSPHPSLGRTGAVCPFTPLALKFQKILTKVDFRTIEELDLTNIFLQIKSNLVQSNDPLLSYVIFFPSLPDYYVAKVQRMFKREFVSSGLMIGEFFRGNKSRGLHNKFFFPLQANIPCLAFRLMVKEDFVFMDKTEYSLEEKMIFKFHFYRRFPLIFVSQNWPLLLLGALTAFMLVYIVKSATN